LLTKLLFVNIYFYCSFSSHLDVAMRAKTVHTPTHWLLRLQAEELEAAVAEATTSDELRAVDFSRLVVTWEGFDARMMPALHAAIQRHPASEVVAAGEWLTCDAAYD
jgi:hypothetical protein